MAFINLTVVLGFAQERALNCCAVIIVCDVDPPVLEPKRGLCRGHRALFVKPGPTPRDVSRSCAQAQWHSCQTWLCFGRRKNAELCWHISGKTADMARLGDYFIVVGYDQEKAGKFGRRGGSRTAVRG